MSKGAQAESARDVEGQALVAPVPGERAVDHGLSAVVAAVERRDLVAAAQFAHVVPEYLAFVRAGFVRVWQVSLASDVDRVAPAPAAVAAAAVAHMSGVDHDLWEAVAALA